MTDPERARASVRRLVTLPPEAASAGASRRLLREVLTGAGREEWVDVGELAISEVVTNAALHAHTDIDVAIAVHDDRVEVEVGDRNPVLPVLPDYEDEATTGRGLALVAAITSACGVRSLPGRGKVAWFRLDDHDHDGSSDDGGPRTWALEPAGGSAEPVAGAVSVVLEPMPVTLWVAARQHHDAILRELVLYLAEHDDVGADLVAADRARGHVSAAVQRWHDGAGHRHADGGPGPTLEVEVPAGVGPDIAALRAALDVAEDLALAGRLLANPGLPEIVAVRDWAFDQIIAQLAGAPAEPWPGGARPDFETAVRARAGEPPLPWDAGEVLDAERGVVAADEANRIVAVSRSLSALLGWRPEDLAGRRVVTLVPPALREAHVAGFSRHLSTGEAHILGVALQLPVLRRDGTEVVCDVLIERAPVGGHRTLYLAWIEAADRTGEGAGT